MGRFKRRERLEKGFCGYRLHHPRENPNLLILVEGIGSYIDPDTPNISQKLGVTLPDWLDLTVHGTWWDGNLMGVRDNPVDPGGRQDRLVYSPHDYGPSVYNQPWFEGNFTRETMDTVWEHFWFFIYRENTAPLLIGEWGGKMDGVNTKWMGYLRDLISEYKKKPHLLVPESEHGRHLRYFCRFELGVDRFIEIQLHKTGPLAERRKVRRVRS
ncbi:MAG: cellulase family glycosylhydrolase [Spirochaetales bacterium]|nr:cellulase family glycosylhydrolase [Spirochaetales bacterium]